MKIDVASISLDVNNFRHAEVKSERDAIRHLLSEEKFHKISELARDIVEQGGLDPSSLLIVTEDEGRPGHYIALEGNRRVTAIKALMTPELAVDSPAYQTFKGLHQRFLSLKLSAVECVVLPRDRAAIWIKRKHYKGMGGAGVLQWNAVATARSDAAEGRHSKWMTALAYLEEHGIDAEEIRDSIARKTTTVERVLASPHIFAKLGLVFGKDGTVVPDNGDSVAAVKLISRLLGEMSDKHFVETVVSNADQQAAFIEKFETLNVKRPNAVDGKVVYDRSTTSNRDGVSSDNNVSASGAASASATSRTPPRDKPVIPRKKLAKGGLRITNDPLRVFYGELKGLDVHKNPHVASAIIRVFVEKSSTLFLEELSIRPLNQSPGAGWQDYGVKLKDKVASVLIVLDPGAVNRELDPARDIANGNRDKLHTADYLNRAVHSHLALPTPTEITTIWDRLHPYLAALFEAVEAKRPQA